MIEDLFRHFKYELEDGVYTKQKSRYKLSFEIKGTKITSRAVSDLFTYERRIDTTDTLLYLTAEMDRLEKLVDMLK